MEILEETTNWKYPNHTYFVDGTKLIGYIPQGKDKPILFDHPLKNFSKRGRAFIKLVKVK
jgi:hypothetical protein